MSNAKIRITVGKNAYSNEFSREFDMEFGDDDELSASDLKQVFKQLRNAMDTTLKDIDATEVAEALWRRREIDRITKEVKAETETAKGSTYQLEAKITELEKEVRKRDCRLDGMIKMHNPEYVIPDDDGEQPQTLD